MRFNVVFNKTSGKNIAKNVAFVEHARPVAIGHNQSMQVAKITSTAVESTVKVNKMNVRGTVVEVKQNFGFIDCDHELVFFHESEINGPISELSAGQVVNFNLMYNTVSNRLVAHCVNVVSDVPKFVGAKFDQATTASVSNGKITSVGNDHGFINEKVHFHYSQLVDTVLEELKVGQSVKFTRNGNTAANVTPVQENSVGLVMAKDLLRVEAAKMLRRLSAQVVVNDFGNELKPMDVSSRKGSIASDLFLTPPDRTSRRGSIVNRIR